ncbi:YicC/YloC family endoribonuclease [Desulfogranum mediterraneum]|uniref:YicC/YloC family endoribonuclease n=1 Tax=Desulfogranum mediterraneum TaxID=160661 RepID=UPI000420CD35|nr:YicC/YloC family endoribonuclease [Desulfogranum mediterraneum]
MTGFGRGEASIDGRTWTAEIKTVNHRFLDQKVTIHRTFAGFEEAVKKRVALVLDRGRVESSFTVQGALSGGPQLVVNEELAAQYHSCLQQLVEEYQLNGGISLAHMLNERDLIVREEQHPDMDAEWELISAALDQALGECERMREQEGAALRTDLLARLEGFEQIIAAIAAEAPQVLAARHADLKAKLEQLLAGVNLDASRLAQEAAVMADKSDITEELVRLGSHIEQFRAFLDSDEPIGRRLDFLLQEFLREVNTLASKITNASIGHLGVEMKNEIEKLREQVQNLE